MARQNLVLTLPSCDVFICSVKVKFYMFFLVVNPQILHKRILQQAGFIQFGQLQFQEAKEHFR